MDEELSVYEREPVYEPLLLCKCLLDTNSSEHFVISERWQQILTAVTRAENYLQDRRIPELIHFLLTKLLVNAPNKPIIYLEKLLNDCMLFRAGHGVAPVLYEDRHLKAVIKSFDPGSRGWLSAGQIRRTYMTLGLTPEDNCDEQLPCDVVFNNLQRVQESELLELLSAGMDMPDTSDISKSNSSV